jgi:hypothetical protein
MSASEPPPMCWEHVTEISSELTRALGEANAPPLPSAWAMLILAMRTLRLIGYSDDQVAAAIEHVRVALDVTDARRAARGD